MFIVRLRFNGFVVRSKWGVRTKAMAERIAREWAFKYRGTPEIGFVKP